jgi:hypothetical protein
LRWEGVCQTLHDETPFGACELVVIKVADPVAVAVVVHCKLKIE